MKTSGSHKHFLLNYFPLFVLYNLEKVTGKKFLCLGKKVSSTKRKSFPSSEYFTFQVVKYKFQALKYMFQDLKYKS